MAFYATIKIKGPPHLQRYKIGDMENIFLICPFKYITGNPFYGDQQRWPSSTHPGASQNRQSSYCGAIA